jgi:hypothetical protein
MGKLSNVMFSGTVANLIFYEINGKHYVRTKPQKIKQTKATKAKSSLFGKASTLAKEIKNCLVTILPDARDRNMQNRLRTAMFNYLNAQQSLQGFEFNSQSLLADKLKLKPLVSYTANECCINFPAFIPQQSIKAPKDASKIVITIAALSIELSNLQPTRIHTQPFPFDYTDALQPANQITFPVNLSSSALLLIVMKMQYVTGIGNIIYKPIWQPCAVVG